MTRAAHAERPRSFGASELAPPSRVEVLIDSLVSALPTDEVARARAQYETRCGSFTIEDPFFEERMRAFSDELVCEVRGEDGLTPAARALRAIETTDPRDTEENDAAWLRGLSKAERGLFVVDARVDVARARLVALLGGARFDVRIDEGPAVRLRPGDVFDGRLAPVGGCIRVLPGLLFHPRQAHEAIASMLADPSLAARSRSDVLDGLARMRMRLDRFVSIHARHVYRVDALDTVEILAASWKR